MNQQRNVVFYGAMSLDGYIARKNHSLDWLIGTEGEEESGYAEFYDTVDTLLMGRTTYEQIQVLSPEAFPYEGKTCYVFSRTTTGSDEHVTFVDEDAEVLVGRLKQQPGQRIWVVGGGALLRPLIQKQLIDEWIVQIAPVILGQGIPLFIPGEQENQLKLLDVRRFGQFAELHYERRSEIISKNQ
ncbi:dihydrofolate reductase family protein [Paenibacillus sp. JX-17]|uniref:Dihydrofolate reductase family protein n=1 Tax=Paenibacillus lacisoli TaxID=3064525 RepID=A0ABT9CHA7_9BACL|nr:dihydrofolate reductase family protein [Paenibacillus sp. JX-17]MDO7908647.1 dihydrofolate reductase family protein [Paenibacillus sp. JX-17]